MARSRTRTKVNWADLNPDVLRIISKKLYDIFSFIRFRAVCKGWRSATDLSDPPRQFPCVMHWTHLGSIRRVYSPASCRTNTIQVRNAKGLQLFGPSGGSVLVQLKSDKGHFSFLNPLSRVKQTLPLKEPQGLIRPVTFGCNPRNVDFAVISGGKRDVDFYFKLSERDQWSEMVFSSAPRAVAYYDHKFFVYKERAARIVVIDETTGAELTTVPSFPDNGNHSNYLVGTTDGLLAINAFIPSPCVDLTECWFEVHRLEDYAQNAHWTKLSAIGDLMLFLNEFHEGFSLNSDGFDGFQGNCIYFTTLVTKHNSPTKFAIGRFDMGLNQAEEISGPTWFTKNSRFCGFFGWFVPTL